MQVISCDGGSPEKILWHKLLNLAKGENPKLIETPHPLLPEKAKCGRDKRKPPLIAKRRVV